MAEPLKKFYDNIVGTGKVQMSYDQFQQANPNELYNQLIQSGLTRNQIGDYQQFNQAYTQLSKGQYPSKLEPSNESKLTYGTESNKVAGTTAPVAKQATNESVQPTGTKAAKPSTQGNVAVVNPYGQVVGQEAKAAPEPKEKPVMPFKFTTSDAVYIIDPVKRKAYTQDGQPAPDAILSTALGEGNLTGKSTQDILKYNDPIYLEEQIREKSKKVRELRAEGLITTSASGSMNMPVTGYSNIAEIEPVERELTQLQRQYAKLEAEYQYQQAHDKNYSEFEQTPEYTTLQKRYATLYQNAPTPEDKDRYAQNFNELVSAEFQKKYGEKVQDEYSKSMLEAIKAKDFLKDDFITNSTDYILQGVNDSLLGNMFGRMTGMSTTNQTVEDYYTPSTIESASRGALSILVDSPLFMVGGSAGGAIAAKVVNQFGRKAIGGLVKAGVAPELAAASVRTGMEAALRNATVMGSSIGALGGYDLVRDVYEQGLSPEEYDYAQTLKALGKGVTLGAAIGWIGIGGHVLDNMVAKSITNRLARTSTKAAIGLTALSVENSAFVYGGALLTGQPLNEITAEQWAEGAVMLGMLKAKGYITKKITPIKAEFTPEELDAMKDVTNPLEEASVPYSAKVKLMAEKGIAVEGLDLQGATAKVVQGDRLSVDFVGKDGELLQRKYFDNVEEANQAALDLQSVTTLQSSLKGFNGLSTVEKAQVSEKLNPEEMLSVRKVLTGEAATEKDLVAVSKLENTVNGIVEAKQKEAENAQKAVKQAQEKVDSAQEKIDEATRNIKDLKAEKKEAVKEAEDKGKEREKYNEKIEKAEEKKAKLEEKAEEVQVELEKTKAEQLKIVTENNPMRDDIHTGIRSEKDIKTFDEVISDSEAAYTPDYTEKDAKKAQETGEITVYSSTPIENGNFVTPSKMEAESYAGDNKVYSAKVKLTDIAWIDALQGQVARTTKAKGEQAETVEAVKPEEVKSPVNEQKNWTNETPKAEVISDKIEKSVEEVGRVDQVGVQPVSETQQKQSKTETGKEIEPNPEVKADVRTVAKELNIEDGDILHLRFNGKPIGTEDGLNPIKDGVVKLKVEDKNGNPTIEARRLKRLEDKGYIVEFDGGEYGLTELGKEVLDRMNIRLETRKGVKEGTDLFPETANIPEYKAKLDIEAETNTGLQAKKKAFEDSLQRVKDLINAEKNLGVMVDPQNEAKKMYDLHKSLVDLAKNTIDYFGTKIINSVEKLAEAIGSKVTTALKRAYSEAIGERVYTEKDLRYNYNKAVQDVSDITKVQPKNVGVAARDMSRTKSVKVLVDEVQGLKKQIKLEAKAAKEGAKYIATFLDANKKDIAAVGLRPKDTIRVQKVAVRNEGRALDLLQRLLTDATYRKSLHDAEDGQDALRQATKGGQFNRLSKGEKDVLNKVVSLDFTGNYFSQEFLFEYNQMKNDVLKNRRVPNPESVKRFYSSFEQEIIDNHLRKELAEDIDVKDLDGINNRIDQITNELAKYKDPAQINKATLQDVSLLKSRFNYLLNKAKNYVRNGHFELTDEQYTKIDARLEEFEAFLRDFSPQVDQAISNLEYEVKKREIANFDTSFKGVFNKYAQRTVDDFRRALKAATPDALSMSDIDAINATIEAIKSGYVPKIITDITLKIQKAELKAEVGKVVLDALRTKMLNVKPIKDLFKKYNTTQSLVAKLDKWDKSDLDLIFDLVKKGEGKPIEELITGRLEGAFFTANREIDRISKPVIDARNKAFSTKIWNVREYWKIKRNREKWDNMIGIALRQANHIANLPNTLKKAQITNPPTALQGNVIIGEYEIIKQDGKKFGRFTSIDEANTYIREHLDEFFTPEELDFYHLVNFGKFKTARANSKIFSNASLNEHELRQFDRAYEELTGGKLSTIRSVEDALNALPAKIRPYAEALLKSYEENRDMAREVASREGVNFVENESYYPYPNKELNVGRVGQTDVTDFNKDFIKVTNVKSGNIYSRVNHVHYTDFNASRVFNGYMRSMVTDYYANPQSKVVMESLIELSKKLAHEFRHGDEQAANLKIAVDAFEQLIKDRFAAQFTSHQLFGNWNGSVKGVRINVGKGLRGILGYGRDVALISTLRRTIPEPLSNLTKIVGGWVNKGEGYNPFRFSSKQEKLMPVFDLVRANVRTLSVDQFQKGNYDVFEMQEGQTRMGEWTRKNVLLLGDMLTSRPIWVSKFESRFKQLTGKELDADRFLNDVEYQDASWKAVEKSMSYADSVVEELFPPQSKFGRAQTSPALGIKTSSDIGAINMIMNSFGVREASTFIMATGDLVYGTNLGRAVAARKMAGLIAANYLWMATGQAVYSAVKYGFGMINDSEADKEKALEVWRNTWSAGGIATNLAANSILLLTGRYANVGRLIAGYASSFAFDKIIDAEIDPAEKKKLRIKIKEATSQMRSIGMNVPETEDDKMNMLFPILYQSMMELGKDAETVATNLYEIGMKVENGTATEDDISKWAIAKSFHDIMILKGYVHPFTKELNMYFRDQMRKDVNAISSYEQTLKQLQSKAESHPEQADAILARAKEIHNNQIKKYDDFAVLREMGDKYINAVENISKVKNVKANETATIKRMQDKEAQYKLLVKKFGEPILVDGKPITDKQMIERYGNPETNPEVLQKPEWQKYNNWADYYTNSRGMSSLYNWIVEQGEYNSLTPEQRKEYFKAN